MCAGGFSHSQTQIYLCIQIDKIEFSSLFFWYWEPRNILFFFFFLLPKFTYHHQRAFLPRPLLSMIHVSLRTTARRAAPSSFPLCGKRKVEIERERIGPANSSVPVSEQALALQIQGKGMPQATKGWDLWSGMLAEFWSSEVLVRRLVAKV